jgi:hypothetical protein
MTNGRKSAKGVKKGTQYAMQGDKSNYFSNPRAANLAYDKESRSRSSNIMRNFSRTMERPAMADVSSLNYLTVLQQLIKVDTITGGDGETAFNNILDDYITRMYTRANDKDLVAANKTAFKAVCCDVFQLMYEYLTQHAIRSISNSITENSATSGAINVAAYWSQDDWDYYTSKLSGYGPIPTFLYRLANLLFGMIVKVSNTFNRWAEVIPPRYMLFWKPESNYAEAVAIRDGLKANAIKAKTFMDKFGVPYETGFDLSKLKLREVTIDDIDVKAMFNHCQVYYEYTTAGAIVLLHGGKDSNLTANKTTAYTNRKYFFSAIKEKGSPQSPIHVMVPLLESYNATNNNYGITISEEPAGAAGNVGLMCAAEDDTSFTIFNLGYPATNDNTIWMRFLAAYDLSDDDKYALAFVGDKAGTVLLFYDYVDYDAWPYIPEDRELVYGTNVGYTECRNNFLNWLCNLKVGTKSDIIDD